MAADSKQPHFSPIADLRLRRAPFWIIASIMIVVVLTWVPLVIIGRQRVSTETSPRVHLFQDMEKQPKFKAQVFSPIFADIRADRPVIEGTVARGQLQEDDHYYRGFSRAPEVKFFDGLPPQIKLTEAFLKRGQERFNIYCAPCHGLDGYGHGPINERAQELQVKSEAQWSPAADLHGDTIRGRADGHLYNTINNGIRNMPGYGAQIPVADRWAIVAYLRALQLSQHAPADSVPPGKLK
jgi:mono/diheme cytochrome c family protein